MARTHLATDRTAHTWASQDPLGPIACRDCGLDVESPLSLGPCDKSALPLALRALLHVALTVVHGQSDPAVRS